MPRRSLSRPSLDSAAGGERKSVELLWFVASSRRAWIWQLRFALSRRLYGKLQHLFSNVNKPCSFKKLDVAGWFPKQRLGKKICFMNRVERLFHWTVFKLWTSKFFNDCLWIFIEKFSIKQREKEIKKWDFRIDAFSMADFFETKSLDCQLLWQPFNLDWML